jgi:hypothetical protein
VFIGKHFQTLPGIVKQLAFVAEHVTPSPRRAAACVRRRVSIKPGAHEDDGNGNSQTDRTFDAALSIASELGRCAFYVPFL